MNTMPMPITETEASKLAIVATMMDQFVREENEAYIEEAKKKEEVFFKMADEIVRLQDLVRNRNEFIAVQEADNRDLMYILESQRIASETMQRTITLNNEHMNVTIPDRRYEHAFATDHLGVTHLVIVERAGMEPIEGLELETEEELEDSDMGEDPFTDEEMDEIVANMDV